MTRGVYTVRLAQGDVSSLQIIHEDTRLWLAIFDVDTERPLIQAHLGEEERRALVAALQPRSAP